MKRRMAWLPACLWMGVIFLMSAAPGEVSGEQSGLVVRVILAVRGFLFGEATLSPDALGLLELLVRKAAHMGEYAVLALLDLYALRKNDARRPACTALLLCALFAAGDELHQVFVPDRGPSPADVAIDTCGALLALALARAVSRLRRTTDSARRT